MTRLDYCVLAFGAFLIAMHVLLALEEWPDNEDPSIVGKHYVWRAQ